MEFMGLVTLTGILGVHELVYAANRLPEPTLAEGPFMTGLIGYFVVLGVWLAVMFRSFRVPK